MTGTEMKETIKAAGVKLWQVAKELGMNDGNFSRRLRNDFSDEETQRILSIVAKLKEA